MVGRTCRPTGQGPAQFRRAHGTVTSGLRRVRAAVPWNTHLDEKEETDQESDRRSRDSHHRNTAGRALNMSSNDELFGTDAVRADLRGHSVRSGVIAVSARVGQALLQLGAVVILARILTPADFGVIAYVVPLAVLLLTVANGALQSAVIHREQLDQAQASRLFGQAAVINFAMSALLAGMAPVVARFYDEPRVTAVTIVWAVIIYLASLAAIPEALLKRQMRFGLIMGAHVGGLALATVIAIGAAFSGAGYWALFIQIATTPFTRGAVVWFVSGWRPQPAHPEPGTAEGSHTRQGEAGVLAMRRYWAGLAGFRAVSWAGDQLDRVLVGFTGSAAALGFYDGARRWGWYPLTELVISLNDVAVSSFSRAREHAQQYRSHVRHGLLPVLALPLPLIAFIFVAAEEVILVLLGDQWVEATPFLQLMCVAAFIGAPARLTPWLYLSLGQTSRQLRWAAFQTVATVAALLVGTREGPIGVAAAFTAITCLLTWPAVAFALQESPVTVRDIVRVVARPTLASLGAAGGLAYVRAGLTVTGPLLLRVAVEAAVFAVVFVLVWHALPGGRAATREAMDALRELDPRRGNRNGPAAGDEIADGRDESRGNAAGGSNPVGEGRDP
jgi:O-antigen/teichoic acid export membrane protein